LLAATGAAGRAVWRLCEAILASAHLFMTPIAARRHPDCFSLSRRRLTPLPRDRARPEVRDIAGYSAPALEAETLAIPQFGDRPSSRR
jgi:hypothetical protein